MPKLPRAAQYWVRPSRAMLPPGRLLGPLGAHPLSKERGKARQARAQSSQVQPDGLEGPACVPGGWVMRELLLAVPRERGVNTVLHQLLTTATRLCLYFRSFQ